MTKKLVSNSKDYIDFDETELLKGNKSTMADYYTKLVSNAILTINEARLSLDYNPVDGADELILPYTDISQNTIGGEEKVVEENI